MLNIDAFISSLKYIEQWDEAVSTNIVFFFRVEIRVLSYSYAETRSRVINCG